MQAKTWIIVHLNLGRMPCDSSRTWGMRSLWVIVMRLSLTHFPISPRRLLWDDFSTPPNLWWNIYPISFNIELETIKALQYLELIFCSGVSYNSYHSHPESFSLGRALSALHAEKDSGSLLFSVNWLLFLLAFSFLSMQVLNSLDTKATHFIFTGWLIWTLILTFPLTLLVV